MHAIRGLTVLMALKNKISPYSIYFKKLNLPDFSNKLWFIFTGNDVTQCIDFGKMAEIPIWVYDRPKWVSGITPATTCQDILGSLATSQSGSLIHPEDLKHLILTEKWRDVEKPLAKDSKILKIWSAWGDEQKFVKFIVKRISRKSHHRGKTGRLRHHRRGSVSSVHSELKFQKKSIFKSTKSYFLTFSKVQKHIFCYFKNGKKSIFAPKKCLKL